MQRLITGELLVNSLTSKKAKLKESDLDGFYHDVKHHVISSEVQIVNPPWIEQISMDILLRYSLSYLRVCRGFF